MLSRSILRSNVSDFKEKLLESASGIKLYSNHSFRGSSIVSYTKMDASERSMRTSGRTPSSKCNVLGGDNHFITASFPPKQKNIENDTQ